MIFPTIKRIFLLMITVFAGNTLLFADPPAPEENPGTEGEVVHVLGDQAFSFSLGGLIPLFHYRFSTENFETTNLFPGAKGTLQYFTYLTNTITVGVELSGGLAFTPNFNIYWFLPLMAKATYRLPIGNFEIPLSLAVGVNFQKYLDWSRADLIIKPEAGFAFRIDPDFTLCFSVGWWLVPSIASEEQEDYLSGQSVLANFLDASVSLIYHF